MKGLSLVITALLIVVLGIISCAPLTVSEVVFPERIPATVLRVIDGDTIEVSIGHWGRMAKVKYIGINAPEIAHPNEEPCGKEAYAKNRELVEGKVVELESDMAETDRYGRLMNKHGCILRYVYVNGLMVNAELVRLGYAQVVTYSPGLKYQCLFLQLQREAREARRGLWATTALPKPDCAVQGQRFYDIIANRLVGCLDHHTT